MLSNRLDRIILLGSAIVNWCVGMGDEAPSFRETIYTPDTETT